MTLKHLFSLAQHHHHSVSSVHVLCNCGILLSADISGLLIVWNLKTRKVMYKRQFEVQILSVSSDGTDSVFVQFRNAEFLVFRMEPDYTLTDAPIKRLHCAEFSFCKHLIIPSQYLIIPADSGLQVIKLDDYMIIFDDFEGIKQHGDMMAIAIDPNNEMLAVGFEDGSMLVYDLSTPPYAALKPYKSFSKISSESITCLNFISELEVLIGGATKSILVLNIHSGAIVSNEKEFRDSGLSSLASTSSFNNLILYSGGWDGKLRNFFFDRSSGKLEPLQLVLEHHYDTINDLHIAHLTTPIPTGPFRTTSDILVSAGKDCIINIWQII